MRESLCQDGTVPERYSGAVWGPTAAGIIALFATTRHFLIAGGLSCRLSLPRGVAAAAFLVKVACEASDRSPIQHNAAMQPVDVSSSRVLVLVDIPNRLA